jgi:hypothetical protein
MAGAGAQLEGSCKEVIGEHENKADRCFTTTHTGGKIRPDLMRVTQMHDTRVLLQGTANGRPAVASNA